MGEQELRGGHGRPQQLSENMLSTKPTRQTSLRVDTESVVYKYSSQGQSVQGSPDTIGRVISNWGAQSRLCKEMTQTAHSAEALEDAVGSFSL